LGVDHFKGIFKESNLVKIGEIPQNDLLFSRLIEEEDSQTLYSEVTKDELIVVIISLKIYKSPSTDGWTTKFIADVFDVLGDNLLRVVEEFHHSGKILGSFN
jgi:hypothetical protein